MRCDLTALGNPTAKGNDMMAGAETRPVNPSVQQSHQSSSPTVSMVVRAAKRGILPTAIVQVRDRFGEYHLLRAMLDSCSEVNLITEEAAKRLQLEKCRVAQAVSGISDAIQNINYSVSTTLKSRMSNFQWTSTFAVIKSICTNQPSGNVDISQWKFPKGIVLADPLFYESNKIHILINTEGFFDAIRIGKHSLGLNQPCLLNTAFGWTVDDLLTGADAIEDLKEKKDQIIALVEKANLQMTKFQSNSADLIASFDHEVPIKLEEEEKSLYKAEASSQLRYLDRWQKVTFLKQQFWNLWHRDYIHTLQRRSKWTAAQPNIRAGQLVIIHEDNTPSPQWNLARVTSAIPGKDGKAVGPDGIPNAAIKAAIAAKPELFV
ncbi:hypothetical protein ACLKA7_001888 [Drosophila subpalustris]